jgi:hypothetical protein
MGNPMSLVRTRNAIRSTTSRGASGSRWSATGLELREISSAAGVVRVRKLSNRGNLRVKRRVAWRACTIAPLLVIFLGGKNKQRNMGVWFEEIYVLRFHLDYRYEGYRVDVEKDNIANAKFPKY